jgi:hypothetical protein
VKSTVVESWSASHMKAEAWGQSGKPEEGEHSMLEAIIR